MAFHFEEVLDPLKKYQPKCWISYIVLEEEYVKGLELLGSHYYSFAAFLPGVG